MLDLARIKARAADRLAAAGPPAARAATLANPANRLTTRPDVSHLATLAGVAALDDGPPEPTEGHRTAANDLQAPHTPPDPLHGVRLARMAMLGMSEGNSLVLADHYVGRLMPFSTVTYGGKVRREAWEVSAQACINCEFQSRRKTCLEPVLAGLAATFGIRFCEQVPGAGADCMAYKEKTQ